MNLFWIVALASVTMLATDVIATVMVMAEARNRGWLAGWLDTAQWLVGIVTTTVSVTALQGHSWTEKILVLLFVSAANLFGTKLGQVIGSHYVTDASIEQRLTALESASARRKP